jgi:carboxypeptidase Q
VRRAATLVVFLAAWSGATFAQDDTLARIRQEGLERSTVQSIFATLTDQFGPRLAGTPEYKASAEWARDRMREMGLADAKLEPFPFGRGWVLDKLVVEMIEPRYMPLIGYAEAWSPSTTGEIVGLPVFLGDKTAAEAAALKDRLKGGIVMTGPQTQFFRDDRPQPSLSDAPVRIGQPPWVTPRRNQADTRAINQAMRDGGAAVAIKTSEGEHGTVFVLGRDAADAATPTVVLAGEHYNMIARMLGRGIAVKLRVNVQSRYLTNDPNSYNVIAEIPGTDPQLGSEVVMIGAHLDSWHTGTGASDNADGTAVAMEAMRILKAVGARPKRTIRIGLWGAEELGLLGSKAYVAQHLTGDANKEARDKLFVYLNLDPASGPIYGWYMQDSEPSKAIFDKWTEPLKDLGMRKNVLAGIGNTDHLSFRAVGVPGFNPIQEYKDYDVRTHHTNVDLYERVREQDLKQNAVVMATFLWQAATTAERLPRP